MKSLWISVKTGNSRTYKHPKQKRTVFQGFQCHEKSDNIDQVLCYNLHQLFWKKLLLLHIYILLSLSFNVTKIQNYVFYVKRWPPWQRALNLNGGLLFLNNIDCLSFVSILCNKSNETETERTPGTCWYLPLTRTWMRWSVRTRSATWTHCCGWRVPRRPAFCWCRSAEET